MQNFDLLNYINQARKSGMADEQIRQGLLQSGWAMNDINEALMNVPAVSAPGFKPKAMMSKTLAVIFIVVGLAVAGYFAGAYYMANYQSFPLWPFEAEVSVPTFTPRPSPVATPDPTADWKTYRNEEYGFEFTLNDSWLNYKTIIKLDSLPQYGDKRIEFYLPTKNVNYKSNLSGYAVIFSILIMNKESWSHISEGPRPVYLGENDKYVFSYDNGYENVPVDLSLQQSQVDQILSTFKFTEGSM